MKYTIEEIERRKSRNFKRLKIAKILMYIVFIPVIIYNITLIVQSIIKPDKVPSFLGVKNFVIISGSMEPTLQIGDIVVVKEVSKEKISVDDIISYRCGQTVITHRVLEIEKEKDGQIKYVTKGDNNNVKDMNSISYSEVEGKIVLVIPVVGKIALAVQNKILILIIMFILFIYYVENSRRQERKRLRKLKRRAMEEIRKEREAGKLEKCQENQNNS